MLRWALAPLVAATALTALAQDREIRLAARERRIVAAPGALGAFAVDPSTAEASAGAGEVSITGRRAGETLVTIVTAAGAETLRVQVDPPAPLPAMLAAQPRQDFGGWELAYDSGTGRLASSLSAELGTPESPLRLRVDSWHERADEGQPARHTLPHASLSMPLAGGEFVLLDSVVQQSPLTLDRVQVRGVHLRRDDVALHAGIASDDPFGDLLRPRSGDRVAAASWRVPAGGITLVPSVALLPDRDSGAPAVVSVTAEVGKPSDPLQVRAEVGWGGQPGAALDLEYRGEERQLSVRARHRPAGFAAVKQASLPGTTADAVWSELFGRDARLTTSASASALDLPQAPQSASARVEWRQQLAPAWSWHAAASAGAWRMGGEPTLRRRSAAAGVAYEGSSLGATALLRYQQTSATAKGGWGGRAALRASGGGWRAGAFLDVQRQAPTLDIVVQDRPDLARALADLGLASGDPDEVLRFVRDHAALLA